MSTGRDLYGNIVLSGGSTLFPGMVNRLTKELSTTIPAAYKVKVIGGTGSNDRKFASWIGGSILASLGTFHQMWLSRAEYEEHGAKVVNTKCP